MSTPAGYFLIQIGPMGVEPLGNHRHIRQEVISGVLCWRGPALGLVEQAIGADKGMDRARMGTFLHHPMVLPAFHNIVFFWREAGKMFGVVRGAELLNGVQVVLDGEVRVVCICHIM
jgi:hypothetical protein